MSKAHIKSKLLLQNQPIGYDQNTIFYLAPLNEDFITNEGYMPTSNIATFKQSAGKLTNGIAVEENTTNIVSNPLFVSNILGYTGYSGVSLTWLKNEYNPISKAFGAMRYYDNDNDTGFSTYANNIIQTDYTSKVILKLIKGNINNINVGGTIWYTDSTYTDYTWTNSNTSRKKRVDLGPNIYELTATITPNQFKTISWYDLRISHNDSLETELIVYAVMLEQKPFSTSFTQATRQNGILKYNLPYNFNSSQGTISFWYYREYPDSYVTNQQTSPKLIQVGEYYTNSSITIWNYVNTIRFYVKGASGSDWAVQYNSNTAPALNDWTHVALSWNNTTWKFYINGQLKTTQTATSALGTINANCIYIGGDGNGTDNKGKVANGILSDIRIDKVERNEEEIFQMYMAKSSLNNINNYGKAW